MSIIYQRNVTESSVIKLKISISVVLIPNRDDYILKQVWLCDLTFEPVTVALNTKLTSTELLLLTETLPVSP